MKALSPLLCIRGWKRNFLPNQKQICSSKHGYCSNRQKYHCYRLACIEAMHCHDDDDLEHDAIQAQYRVEYPANDGNQSQDLAADPQWDLDMQGGIALIQEGSLPTKSSCKQVHNAHQKEEKGGYDNNQANGGSNRNYLLEARAFSERRDEIDDRSKDSVQDGPGK